ncbi:MAG: glycosyl hydrolase family 57 [Omnitrophica WOR_2 bacterium GWF2_38_59]|nr:MAG: glycosyl hydrolase family 57 [Omnitrophica WOR_2 bacterium GWF2_38_59]OGX50183.1 MAG: glycosyl hydrolase family 57 [Omnitrophica WOR_2 bacterium RIFOXYA2_FULL_38_17]OGX57449.1 MAG: glycosyl hydrolase family 57 [Omnitrophica WOR_2 bacterium RIFOXYB2_FULL_38_16]OGX57496.1 MAG: glycosyl hydrolase family 57 [Omnitrophica WOR_2 bacterium RIFOXYC2_FULL_38_12]HBG60472.1 glycosyl hydrolase family 57 [Candidatus Omnitrophota bacterium]
MSNQNKYLPDICGNNSIALPGPIKKHKNIYSNISSNNFNKANASFGFALHMHQPTIPASSYDLANAELISNLQYMMEHPEIGDNHNAFVFIECYSRMADITLEYVAKGKNPRVMLDYSGNLFWGLQQIQDGRVIENLKRIACDKKYHQNVEWLGTMWSHAVPTSTPVPDLKLHIQAWQHHFGSIFGNEALSRVKGFSPPEMHLPIHPDVCYQYIKDLKECGYLWIMVQEHTVENMDGSGIKRPHFPHRLVAKNSMGEEVEIIALIKTQGSDTKLVAQMQPYYEAKSLGRQDYAGKNLPPFVLQIGDGENGGVMMNEYPPCFRQAFDEISTEGTVAMSGTEYIEFLFDQGVKIRDLMPIQPISQHRIWEQVKKPSATACDDAIKKIHEKDSNFNLDKGSWTNERSWISGYKNVLDPMNKLSVMFHEKFDSKNNINTADYKEALLYLMISQTSCFRYWGEGMWTDYAKEICTRGMRLSK